MRALHTSDWHLGQSFFGESRLAEHRAFLDFLLSRCVDDKVDVLLVSGDVFDTLNPPAEAEEAWYSFLARLSRVSPTTHVHVIAGNHDSPARLGAPRAVLRSLAVEVHERLHFLSDADAADTRGENRWRLDPKKHLVRCEDTKGGVCIFGFVPFVRPAEVPGEFGPEGTRPLHDFLTLLFSGLRADSAKLFPREPLILAGHLFAAGGEVSAHSERRIQRGNLDALPLDAFRAGDDACRYVALGHLHRAQCLQKGDARTPHVRYSGSPLPLSFTEIDYPHQVVLVDVEPGDSPAVVREIRVPRPRRLLRLPTEHGPAANFFSALRDAQSAMENEIPPLVEARILVRGPTGASLRPEIEKALREKGMRLLQISLQRESIEPDVANASQDSRVAKRELQDFSALEIFERCHVTEYGTPATDDLRELFLECVEAAQAEEGGAVADAKAQVSP